MNETLAADVGVTVHASAYALPTAVSDELVTLEIEMQEALGHMTESVHRLNAEIAELRTRNARLAAILKQRGIRA